jgi:ribosomal protein S18 acetylase RimI-like enzyme
MAIELDGYQYLSTPCRGGAEIKENNDHLDEWMVPLIEAFESTYENTLVYRKAHEAALAKGTLLYHFSVYDKGNPVSSLTVSVHGTSARIDDVGTLPACQGKGYASCLVAHALGEAKKRGAAYCFLEASSQGLSLYKRIGFKPVHTYLCFSLSKKIAF